MGRYRFGWHWKQDASSGVIRQEHLQPIVDFLCYRYRREHRRRGYLESGLLDVSSPLTPIDRLGVF